LAAINERGQPAETAFCRLVCGPTGVGPSVVTLDLDVYRPQFRPDALLPEPGSDAAGLTMTALAARPRAGQA